MADRPPTVEYQQDQSMRAIRRGVRILVFLTLVNTILLGAGFFAPAIVAIAKEQWAAYQKSQADAAAIAQKAAIEQAIKARRDADRPKLLAAQSQAMNHLWPSGSLVFAEDFAVGTLPTSGATLATMPATRNATTRGSAAAAVPSPAFLASLPIPSLSGDSLDASDVILFCHARRARPEWPERLVIVTVDLEPSGGQRRRLRVWTVRPTSDGDALVTESVRSIYIDLSRTILRRGESVPPALRFYAGTPDPLEESGWSVRYEFGAGVGTLSGRLRADDHVDVRVDGPLTPIVSIAN